MTDTIVVEDTINVIRTTDDSRIIAEDNISIILDDRSSDRIVEILENNSVIGISEQGPPGPAGPTGDEDVAYAKLIDSIDDDHIYIGEADPGTLESDAGWRIKYVIFTGDDTSIRWANGTGLFDKTWTDRATYTYL